MRDGAGFMAGDSLLVQLLTEGIYASIPGLTYVEISTACKSTGTELPGDMDYQANQNVPASARQKILLSDTRMEVRFVADT